MFKSGAKLDIKLKQKLPKAKSKKVYKGIYIRSLDKGKTIHLYDVTSGLYLASIYMKDMEFVHLWITNNLEKIRERVNQLVAPEPTLF